MASHVFVVEGKTDKALLQTYVNSYIVITDGTNVSRETIRHLQALEKYHNIVIITDPDQAGNEINAKIAASLAQPIIIRVTKREMISNEKIGLAQIKRDVLRKKLKAKHYKTIARTHVDYYEFWEFYQKHLQKDGKLSQFINHFSLWKTSRKTMHKQLQYLGITMNEIIKWNKQ